MMPRLVIASLLLTLLPQTGFTQNEPMPRMSDADPADATPVTPLAEVLVIGEPADDTTPDLILIPGIGLSLEAWRPWMETNAARYRMHAITLPGMAGTEPPPLPDLDDLTISTPFLDNAADAIAAYIEANELDHPIVIGHGTGGMVAMLTAVRHADLLGGFASITMPPAVPIGNDPATEAERLDHAFNRVQPRRTEITQQQAAFSIRGTYAGVTPPGPLQEIAFADAARCEPHVLSQYWPEVVSMDLIDELAALEDLPGLLCLPMGGPFRWAPQWHAAADAMDSVMLVEFATSPSFCHYDEPRRFEAALAALIERAHVDAE